MINLVEEFEKELHNIEVLQEYGGWDDTREDVWNWVQVNDVIKFLQKYTDDQNS